MNQERLKIQNEILESVKQNNYNGCVIAPTGTGKAYIMVQIIKLLDPKTILYTCDNKILRDKTFREEVIKWGAEKYLDRMEMQCYQTTHKWKDKHFDLLLADEADFCVSPKYINLIKNNTFTNKVLFTGTLSDDKRRILKKYVPIVHEVEIAEVEDRKALNKANVIFVNYELTAIENARYLGFNESFKKILNKPEMGWMDKMRLKQIQQARSIFLKSLGSSKEATRTLLKRLYADHNNKILIFCGLTEQADSVCRWSYHGKNEGLEYLDKFNKGEIRVLSVVAKIDRGLNINGINTVIFEAPTRSKTKTMQQSGRSRRLGVDEVTNLYFMIPYYKDRRGVVRPTVVQDYVFESGQDLNLETAKIINISI